MKLDLTEILLRVGMRYPYEVSEPPIVDEDVECVAPIDGKLIFTNTGEILLIEGNVETRAVLACSRCLTYFEDTLSVPIEEQFEIGTKLTGPKGRHTEIIIEEDENPDAGKLFEGTLFNLTELLRQGIMLALPSQPLHDVACKGLCASCGTNLNESSCACSHKSVNPAFAKLGALLEESSE